MNEVIRRVRRRPGFWIWFKHWFNSYEHYFMRFDSNKLLMNLLYMTVVSILLVFVYNIIDVLNDLNLFFFRFGSVVLVFLLYFFITFLYLVIRDLRKGYHNLRKGFRVLIMILIIIFMLVLLINQEYVGEKANLFVNSFDLYDFNVFSVSNVIGGTDVVDPNSIGFSYDARSIIDFLPLPFGFALLWVVIVGVLILGLINVMFFGELPNWLILVILFLFLLMAFGYKIPYEFVETNGIGLCDLKGNLVFESLNPTFNSPCLDYVTSECRPVCLNKKTACQCEATFYDFMFKRNELFYG